MEVIKDCWLKVKKKYGGWEEFDIDDIGFEFCMHKKNERI